MSASCCSFYSATGGLFMAFVTVMLTTQPTYITGIHDYDAARSSAFGAMMAFGVTFAISAFILVKNRKSEGGVVGGTSVGGEVDYDDRLNIDLRRNYGEKKVYGSVATDSY
ncbi:hypothetical protein ACHAXH_002929 [Discostella pseudostelligera]